jgi:hypothetical protein
MVNMMMTMMNTFSIFYTGKKVMLFKGTKC